MDRQSTISQSPGEESGDQGGNIVSDAASIQAALQRILDSKSFVTSARHSRFLRYTVEETLHNRSGNLKEHLLGLEVFDRKSPFDPHVDPIVRVEASRVRAKLKLYYETDGRDDPVRIEFPKGTYTPIFRSRPAPVDHGREERPSRLINRRWVWVGAVAGLLSLATTTGWVFGHGHGSLTVPLALDVANTEFASVAVLPFVNLSPEKDAEYFSDGLTDELISRLTKIGSLQVVARTSVFQFKGKTEDIRKLGTELNAATVLEGSVRKAGNRLRIAVQLTDVATGYDRWSDTYDCEVKDVFNVQEEISRAIVNTLLINRAGGHSAPLVKQHTSNLEAYNLYLEGLYRANQQSESGLRQGIELLQKSIQTDPDFAPAYASVATAYTTLAHWDVVPVSELAPKATAAAERALGIDANLGEALTSLATLDSLQWQWSRAKTEFERAIQLDPSSAHALERFVMGYLLPMKQLDQALAHMQRAVKLDPFSAAINMSLGMVYYCRRDYYDGAIERTERRWN